MSLNKRLYLTAGTTGLLLMFLILASCQKSNDAVDLTPPGKITNLADSVGNETVLLKWSNPTDADFHHVSISFETGFYTTSKSKKLITGLTNGKTYTFVLIAYDKSGNASEPVSIDATPRADSSKKLYPSDILPGLTKWKITLPVDKNGKGSEDASKVENRNTNPWEVIGKDLIHFEYSPFFEVRDSAVVFRAPCWGATTRGSKYPRCELRQEVGGGNNYWSFTKHQKLEVILAVTHTPVQKPTVCMTQIHGPENEPLRLQYDASKGLELVWNESHFVYFRDQVDYSLGQKLHVIVEVKNGDITCTVTNMATGQNFSKTWTPVDKTAYFKVGCYTQSSIFLSQFKSGYNDENMDAYGEVLVSKINLLETY
jgi:hypothetical protein